MASLNLRKEARLKRKKRIKKKILGTQERPRLSVFRTAKHIYAQVIDDTSGHTIAAASSLEKAIKEHPEFGTDRSKGKISLAIKIGKLIAERAIEREIKKVVFDRNGFLYHGRVKAVSDGAREGGLVF